MKEVIVIDEKVFVEIMNHISFWDKLFEPAMIIAITALLFTFWQGYINRKQSRLNLRPNINVNFRHLYDVNKSQKLTLTNTGLGPAIIKKIEFIYMKKPYSTINEIFLEIKEYPVCNVKPRYKVLFDDYVIMTGEDVMLHETSCEDFGQGKCKNKCIYNEWSNNLLNKIELNLEYKSYYNETFKIVGFVRNVPENLDKIFLL